MLPRPGTFVRHLVNGWVATLTVMAFTREEIELSPWGPGMKEVVEIESSVCFPPAEILAAHLGMAPGLDFEAAPPFRVPGEREALRQLRGPQDHERVVAEIVEYAEEVLVPAAHEAGLDRWMAAYAAIGRDDPEVLVWEVPVMLVTHGRAADAVERLQLARYDPELATTEFTAFADRTEAFVRSGASLPTDGAELAAIAAEHERRLAEVLKQRAARRKAERLDVQVAVARLVAVVAGLGIRALWRRRGHGGTA